MSVKKRREQKRRRAEYVEDYLCTQGIESCPIYPECGHE